MRLRKKFFGTVIVLLVLGLQAGYGATNRPRNELPIPQLRNAPPARQAKPDLVVRSLAVRDKGRCEPGSPVITFDVIVANTGTAPYAVTADVPMVVKVVDRHDIGWAGTAELKDAIPPGGAVTVAVQVPYFRVDPAHMASKSPHPFTAIVSPGGLPDKLRNGVNEPPPVGVSLPENCGRKNQ